MLRALLFLIGPALAACFALAPGSFAPLQSHPILGLASTRSSAPEPHLWPLAARGDDNKEYEEEDARLLGEGALETVTTFLLQPVSFFGFFNVRLIYVMAADAALLAGDKVFLAAFAGFFALGRTVGAPDALSLTTAVLLSHIVGPALFDLQAASIQSWAEIDPSQATAAAVIAAATVVALLAQRGSELASERREREGEANEQKQRRAARLDTLRQEKELTRFDRRNTWFGGGGSCDSGGNGNKESREPGARGGGEKENKEKNG